MEKREDGNDSAQNNCQHEDALPINVKPEARLKAALLCQPENTKLQWKIDQKNLLQLQFFLHNVKLKVKSFCQHLQGDWKSDDHRLQPPHSCCWLTLALLQDSCVPHTGLEHPSSPLSSSLLLSGTCECQLNCSINCLCAEKQYLTERSEEDVTPAAAIIWKVAAN